MRLVVTLVADRETHEAAPPQIPASLVRLGRTARFRQAADVMARSLGQDAEEFTPAIVAVLATLADAIGRDVAEPDWWRLLDAVLLIAAHPAVQRVTP